jgi:hypothetical protein
LRVTAGPRARLSENATEIVVIEGSGHHVHQRAERRIRVPSVVRRRKASRPRIRPIKRRGEPGPWRGGSSARRARRGSTSGRGSRGAWLAGDCWAEMCASRSPPRPLWRARRASGRCLLQDGLCRYAAGAHVATRQGYRATEGARQLVCAAPAAGRSARFGGALDRATVLRLPRDDQLVHTCGQACGRSRGERCRCATNETTREMRRGRRRRSRGGAGEPGHGGR